MWIVELICGSFPRSLNGDCTKLLSARKPTVIVKAARVYYHRSWYYRTTLIGKRRTTIPPPTSHDKPERSNSLPPTKFLNDEHPQASSLPTSALRECVTRTGSSQELSPHQSPKREVANQRANFVIARPTQRCDMKLGSTEATRLPVRHSDNRPLRIDLPAQRLSSVQDLNARLLSANLDFDR